MRVALAVLVALHAGCASFAGLQGASALPDGQTRWGLAGSGVLAAGNGVTAGVAPEYLFRAGLGDGLDYGFRAFGLGLAGDIKEVLHRSRRLTIAWSPSASVFFVSRTRGASGGSTLAPLGTTNAGVSLIAGLRMPGGELTLAPRALVQVQQGLQADERASIALLSGLSLGASIEVLESIRLLYEGTFLWVPAARGAFAPFTRPGLVPYGAGSVFGQLTVGVAFGR